MTVAGVTERLEGEHRGRRHFDGVATVVAKLLNMVGPDVAFFGQKDAQQALVIKRLVADLNFPVRIEVCPTVREPDGLAMSSRNVHLTPDRPRAGARPAAARSTAAQDAVRDGERDPAAVTARALAQLRAAALEPEYFDLADPETLAPVVRLDQPALALVAARVGGTRLIDNQLLPAAPAAELNTNGRP